MICGSSTYFPTVYVVFLRHRHQIDTQTATFKHFHCFRITFQTDREEMITERMLDKIE